MSKSEKGEALENPGTEFPLLDFWRISWLYQSLSRKGFGLGTWDELGKLPSRPDFSYSRKKKKKFLDLFYQTIFGF